MTSKYRYSAILTTAVSQAPFMQACAP